MRLLGTTFQTGVTVPLSGAKKLHRGYVIAAVVISIFFIVFMMTAFGSERELEDFELSSHSKKKLDPVAFRPNHGLQTSTTYTSYVVSPLPDPNRKFPKTFDWTDHNGYDLTTVNRNQHNPHYCGACWVFGAAAVLDDRMNTMPGVKHLLGTTWMTSVQAILTCGPRKNQGCEGGNPNDVFNWLFSEGAPHDTCHNYEALDGHCDHAALCMDCEPASGPAETTKGMKICRARAPGTYPLVTVTEFGRVAPQGELTSQWFIDDMVKRMKAEIYERGPIACQIACAPIEKYFPNLPPNPKDPPYKKVIFDEKNAHVPCKRQKWDDCVDHIISIAGWGVDKKTGMEYWHVRNSWGVFWGEMGWFRVRTGKNVMGIESGCDWAIPHVLSEHGNITEFLSRRKFLASDPHKKTHVKEF